MMSAVSTQPQETVDKLTLADLLKPMQFKTVLLAACGLTNCEIAHFLGTTEQVITSVLADVYRRTSCLNSGEVILRYFREASSALLELARLRRVLAELEARSGQNLHARLGDLLQYIN
jgi:DNA-binding NarL/FixJ family response regulator